MDRILLVEDDASVADIIRGYVLSDERYAVEWAQNAQQALQIARGGCDLILLDIMLPDVDGLALCASFRQTLFCPILFVSSLDDERTIVRALQLGGDDYIVKPFKAAVLLAKIEANLRRLRNSFAAAVEEKGALALDENTHTLKKLGGVVYLSPTEFYIMQFFMRNPRRTLELEEIFRAIWQQPSYGDVRTVPVHIRNLRKKIEDDPDNPRYIKTIKRIGYWFENV